MHAARLTALALGLLLIGAAPAKAEPRGKVYFLVNPQAPREQWERRPLPGAFVTLSWTMTIPAPAHAVSSCRYSELARTDANGEYVMEGPNPVTAHLADASYWAYSPGLEPVPFPYGGSAMLPKDITMTFSTRSAEERLSHLSLATRPGCGGDDLRDPQALYLPYLRALLDEARTLKVDSAVGQREVQYIEAVLRHASGGDQPQPLRVVPVQGSVEAVKVRPPQ